jgi:subtilisin family serine protease
VAGTAAATDNSTGIVGVAPGAHVINVNVFGNDGQAHSSEIMMALDRIIARKKAHPQQPMVVNLSLGARVGTTAYGPLDRAVRNAIQAGIPVVVAAGNQRVNAATVSPAHVTEAITVGAYNPANLFAAFSNYGPALDLLAPGVEVPSLLPSQDGAVRTGRMSGTSAAAPHVTGAVARYLAQHPTATPKQVRDALVGSSQPHIGGVPPGTTNRTVWIASTAPEEDGGEESAGDGEEGD